MKVKILNKNNIPFGYWSVGTYGDHVAVIYKSKLKYKYVQKALNDDILTYAVDESK